MAYKLTTAPATYPVTLEQVKMHLKLPSSYVAEDERLNFFIKAATAAAESYTGRQLCTANYTLYLDSFKPVIYVDKCPVTTISAIKYVDQNGSEQTVDAANYVADTVSEPARIVPRENKSWPSTASQPNAVIVELTAGYSDVSQIPQTIVWGILLMIGDLWQNRENVVIGRMVQQIPRSSENLFALEKVHFVNS